MILPRPVERQQLFLMLQERIERRHYAPGSWLPAERALAEEFSMDRSAVREALRQLEDLGLIVREAGKRPWVRGSQAPTRPGSHQAASAGHPPEAGTQTKARAQTIVAILPQHPIYLASLAIMHGINAALRSAPTEFRMQIVDTHGGSKSRETWQEKQALESVLQENIAGVILWHVGGAETVPQLRALEQRGIPVVFIDRFSPDLACDFVGSDNYSGMESAVEYLRQIGHHRIAHLTSDEQATSVLERLAAYTEIMRAGGIQPRTDWIFQLAHDSTTDTAPACDHYFALGEPPTAVIAMNDALAYHFMAECQTRGKSVPEDISVIGFDDLERHSPRPPMLTTLHQPFDKMGRRAADLLLRRLAEPGSVYAAKQHMLLPTPLIKRLTCRAL